MQPFFSTHCLQLSLRKRYHSARNQFERFREFLEWISRFEFDFRRHWFFWSIRISGVFKVQPHTVAVHVHVLWLVCTHNSISNVVASVTIHDDKKLKFTFSRDSSKKHETIVEGQRLFQPNIMESVRRANRQWYLGFGGEWHIEPSGDWFLRSVPQESWSWTTLSVKRTIGGIGNMLVSIFSQTEKCVRYKGFFGEPLVSSDNSTWANFGKENWRWHFACSVLCVVRCVCCWCAVCGCWCVGVGVGVGVSRWPFPPDTSPLCTFKTLLPCVVGAFQLKVSVDQDLSVIVAETINDDDVKQRLVPIVFTRAWHSNVAQARRHDSRAPIYTKRTPTLANKGSRKWSHTNWCWKHGELWRQDWSCNNAVKNTYASKLWLHADQKGDKTVEFLPKKPRIPENMVGTKNTNNRKTRISSTPAEHDRGLFIQFVTKLRHSWPSENVETQKLSHTEGRKITSTLTKCLDRADGSFHMCPLKTSPVCTVTTPASVTTCGRGGGTHGDVLNVHTPHAHTPRPQQHTNKTQQEPPQQHTETGIERDRERERERETEKDRQEKTRQDKKSREEGKRREKMKE